MTADQFPACTAFQGHRLLAAGLLDAVALAVKRALKSGAQETVLVYEDANGRLIDLDLRGSDAQLVARLPRLAPPAADAAAEEAAARGPGRPRLGVVAREVTLLPRHWDWLAAQPGGASVALRKLVETARRDSRAADLARARTESAYRFMSSLAGDLPGFEEASRALFAGDRPRFNRHTARWPTDVRDYARRLAFAAVEGEGADEA